MYIIYQIKQIKTQFTDFLQFFSKNCVKKVSIDLEYEPRDYSEYKVTFKHNFCAINNSEASVMFLIFLQCTIEAFCNKYYIHFVILFTLGNYRFMFLTV